MRIFHGSFCYGAAMLFFIFIGSQAQAQVKPNCHLEKLPETVVLGYQSESSLVTTKWGDLVSVNCDTKEPKNYCITIEAADPGHDGHDFHRLWLKGDPSKESYVAMYFQTPSGDRWGNPDGSGADKGVGIVGYQDSSMAGQPIFYDVFDINASKIGAAAGLYKADFRLDLYAQYTNPAGGNPTNPPDLCSAAGRHTSGGSDITTIQHTSHNFTFTVVTKSSCKISVNGAIAFQQSFSIDNVPPAKASVHVSCSPGTEYEIGWDEGQNYQSSTNHRAMKCRTPDKCKDGVIEYDLYKPNNGGLWRNTSPAWVVPGTATKTGEDYEVTGEVYPGQKQPLPGNYQDTAVATLRLTKIPGDNN